MTGKERSDLGFGNEFEDFNPEEWQPPAPRSEADRQVTRQTKDAAVAARFRSREPGQGARKQRRRRTGRNAQLNIKTTPAAIEEFMAIADTMGWGLGETLENALPLLRREFLQG